MEGETPEQFRERIRSIGVSKGRQTKTTPVIADEGTFRGQEVGFHTEHADGRVDATSTRQDLRLMPNVTVVRDEEH
jgi:hypothetical protein